MLTLIRFDWAGCQLLLRFSGSSSVYIDLEGGGNLFNVQLDGRPLRKLKAKRGRATFLLCSGLDASSSHLLELTKRTDPRIKSATSKFSPVSFHSFVLDKGAQVLPVERSSRRIEFIV